MAVWVLRSAMSPGFAVDDGRLPLPRRDNRDKLLHLWRGRAFVARRLTQKILHSAEKLLTSRMPFSFLGALRSPIHSIPRVISGRSHTQPLPRNKSNGRTN